VARLTRLIVSIVVVAALAACGSSTSTTASQTHHAAHLSRHQVCQRLARFVSNYDYIQQGTSVRAYDILYHSLQVSCPRETRAAQLVGVTNRPPCKTMYQSRFTCQAVHDPYLAPLDTGSLRADLP
jgi:hypothetical protein